MATESSARTIGIFGATFVGIGAIVGGGIFVLGGIAVRETGPAAILAFLANGVIAFLTAKSFAELSKAFPESGGPYTYAKRILSVRSAFAMGWILWLAHMLAALLYALGFAAYFQEALRALWSSTLGTPPSWLLTKPLTMTLAGAAAIVYTARLISQKSGKDKNLANIIKLAIFSILILWGFSNLITQDSAASITEPLTPFFPLGATGFFAAMGFTFIALQGFDIIAAIAGEVKEPSKTIPRAMQLSLFTALIIYLPLLFLLVTAGVPAGEQSHSWCAARAETCFAEAAHNFTGPLGYWLVVMAAVFATLSALYANLLASSRIVFSMAVDRTAPRYLAHRFRNYPTPVPALMLNLVCVVFLLAVIPDLASAGAAASLVFLVCYAFSHVTNILARKRKVITEQSRLFGTKPIIQIIGGTACAALALFQAIVVPSAGAIICAWLVLGAILYFTLFSSRAEALDASLQARFPELLTSRGKTPFVLVPISNPKTAPTLVSIAHAIASPMTGRVLLLKVVKRPPDDSPEALAIEIDSANEVLKQALMTSLSSAVRPPETLLTVSDDPWSEIIRVANTHRCESLVLGLGLLPDELSRQSLKRFFSRLTCSVVIAQAPESWSLENVKRVLVPIGGSSEHDSLRARVLGALMGSGVESITLLGLLSKKASAEKRREVEKGLQLRAQDEADGRATVVSDTTDNISEYLIESAKEHDLLIMGLTLGKKGHIELGKFSSEIAKSVSCATLFIGTQKS